SWLGSTDPLKRKVVVGDRVSSWKDIFMVRTLWPRKQNDGGTTESKDSTLVGQTMPFRSDSLSMQTRPTGFAARRAARVTLGLTKIASFLNSHNFDQIRLECSKC